MLAYIQYLLEALHKAQNRAARFVTKLDWSAPVAELLKQCGWLSVHKLVVYHSVVLVYKVMKNESPQYLHSMFSAKYKYKTKQAHNGMLRHTRDLGLEINQNSFRWRAAKSYNELPLEIKNIPTLEGFKKGVKTWIKQNTSLYQD